jgi:hypothetical protein
MSSSRPINPRNWLAVDMTTPIIGEATPPATAALLIAADDWCVSTATAPYAGCGHVFDALTEAGIARRYLAIMVAPGAVHARAALSRTYQLTVATGHSADYNEIFSQDSGATAAELIQVPGQKAGIGYTPTPTFKFGATDIVLSGSGIEDSPTTAQDRQIELATMAAPYLEPMYVTDVSGFSVCITDQVPDLTTL